MFGPPPWFFFALDNCLTQLDIIQLKTVVVFIRDIESRKRKGAADEKSFRTRNF